MPNDVETATSSHVCTISIECSTLLDNMDVLPKEKHEFVPTDGVILATSEVEFEEGTVETEVATISRMSIRKRDFD